MNKVLMKYNINDKNDRVAIFAETVRIVEQGNYTSPDGMLVELPDDETMRKGTILYEAEQPKLTCPMTDGHTEIKVFNKDCLEVAKDLLDGGFNPAVLNLASSWHPGGGVVRGSSAQEESIFRRTNLYRSLYQFAKNEEDEKADDPIDLTRTPNYKKILDHNYGGIYTPGATVFRSADCALLDKTFQMSFITVAAVKRPQLTINGHLKDFEKAKTRNKIRTILRMGITHGHDSLVLGALGCGAYGNPPVDIAYLFHQILLEDEFRNKFKKIVFAVMGNRNYEPFRKEFE